MAKFTQSVVDALKTWFATGQSFTDKRGKEFIKAIQHGIAGHGHSAYGGPGDTAGDAAGVWNIQAGDYNDAPPLPKQGDLYVALNERALLGCFKANVWTTIAACRTRSPTIYTWWPTGTNRYVYFYTGTPPDTLIFSAIYPGDWRYTYNPRAVQTGATIYAVWDSWKTAVSRYRILFAVSTNWGATFSDPIILSDEANEPTFNHTNADLSLDAFGNIHATWTGWTGSSDRTLFYTKSLDGGETWSTPVIVATGLARPPRIAVHILASYIVIIYKTPAGNLYAYRSEDGGENWEGPIYIPAGCYAGYSGPDYDLRFKGNVLWGASTDANRVHAFRSLDYGENWTVWPRQLSGTVPDGYGPPQIHAQTEKLWIIYPYYTSEDYDRAAVDITYTLDNAQTWKWARVFSEAAYYANNPSLDLWGGALHATWLDSYSRIVDHSLSKDQGKTWEDKDTIIDPEESGTVLSQLIAEQHYTA